MIFDLHTGPFPVSYFNGNIYLVPLELSEMPALFDLLKDAFPNLPMCISHYDGYHTAIELTGAR